MGIQERTVVFDYEVSENDRWGRTLPFFGEVLGRKIGVSRNLVL